MLSRPAGLRSAGRSRNVAPRFFALLDGGRGRRGGARPPAGPGSSGRPATTRYGSGLVGCGDRGTGAATQALAADSGVVITALGDLFEDRLARAWRLWRSGARSGAGRSGQMLSRLRRLRKGDRQRRRRGAALHAPRFSGPASGGGRGGRQAQLRRDRGGGRCPGHPLVSGLGRVGPTEEPGHRFRLLLAIQPAAAGGARADPARAIGEVRALYATYYRSRITHKHLGPRDPKWSDLEWQIRDWHAYTWLSGDVILRSRRATASTRCRGGSTTGCRSRRSASAAARCRARETSSITA